jgi:membrane-bound lytic murein transglycosylase F
MRKNLLIRIILGGLILIFAIVVTFHHRRNRLHDLPGIIENGRITVLTDSSRLGFSVKRDSVFGFQYEIVKAFADSMGLELVITKENDLEACMNSLKSGDYDIIANLIPVTSRPILVQRMPEDTTRSKLITNHYQLLNDTVYLPYHSPYKMRLEHLSDEIAGTIHIIEMKNISTEQMVRLVSEGKIKYTICDELFAKKLKLQYPNIDISLPIGFEQQLAWAVHLKSPQLLAKLNDFLTDFMGSEGYWDIYRKYF